MRARVTVLFSLAGLLLATALAVLTYSLARTQLSRQRDDVALQNVQARARGPAVWLLANLRGALLLTTSNRSEAAVGYATMDGDTCGGLVPTDEHCSDPRPKLQRVRVARDLHGLGTQGRDVRLILLADARLQLQSQEASLT